MADWFVFCLLATGIQIDGCRNEVAKKNAKLHNPQSAFRIIIFSISPHL